MARKRRQTQLIECELSDRERTLILDHTFAGPNLTDKLENAETRGGKLIVKYSLDELDELLGYIAAEANHTENEKLERDLDRLYGRLEEYEHAAKLRSILTGQCSS